MHKFLFFFLSKNLIFFLLLYDNISLFSLLSSSSSLFTNIDFNLSSSLPDIVSKPNEAISLKRF